ncbi:MAG: ABC transporter ATP-binding protein [Armatimonadetes bacterium]|nr:ABC transporter ATP-binding protein [Armatimonadota bacterium]
MPKKAGCKVPDIIVQVQNLVKQFGSFKAVDDVSFDVYKGEIFGFLGPNGAGISTTIRMLCGLLTPTSGTGSVAGLDIMSQSEQIKARIGYMSQRFSLYEDLTVAENIEFYAGIYNVRGDRFRRRREWILEMAGLVDHQDSLAGVLSMGWKQRLALGTAVVHEPEILFLDEPTSGVDPISRRQFWELIHEVAGVGVTVFVTTHFMDEAEHCDRLTLIYRGKRIAMGAPKELKADFAGNTLLEIAATPVLDTLTALEGAPSVRDAALFGTNIHVVIEGGYDRSKELEIYLRENKLDVAYVRAVEPSPEDVFVSLVEKADRESAATSET